MIFESPSIDFSYSSSSLPAGLRRTRYHCRLHSPRRSGKETTAQSQRQNPSSQFKPTPKDEPSLAWPGPRPVCVQSCQQPRGRGNRPTSVHCRLVLALRTTPNLAASTQHAGKRGVAARPLKPLLSDQPAQQDKKVGCCLAGQTNPSLPCISLTTRACMRPKQLTASKAGKVLTAAAGYCGKTARLHARC